MSTCTPTHQPRHRQCVFVLCELPPPVITAAAVPVSALARGAHAVAPAVPLVPEPRRFQSQENGEEHLWFVKKWRILNSLVPGLTAYTLCRCKFNSIQYTIRFNLDLAKVSPSRSKLKSIQFSSQFTMCIWPHVYPISSKRNSNLFSWQFNSVWNWRRVSPARSNFRSIIFTVHLSVDVAKGHSDEVKVQFNWNQNSIQCGPGQRSNRAGQSSIHWGSVQRSFRPSQSSSQVKSTYFVSHFNSTWSWPKVNPSRS